MTKADSIGPGQAAEPSLPPADASTADFEGWLDHVSLTLSMTGTRQQLISDLKAQSKNQPLGGRARTYVHELAHVSQALGTTLGYYIWMLRSVQVDSVLRILTWFADTGLPLRTPLLKYTPTIKVKDAKLTGLLHGWQIAEMAISELAGTQQGFLHTGMVPAVFATPWPQRFKRLQSNITEIYETSGTRYPQEFFLALFNERVNPSSEEHEAMIIAMMATVPFFSVASVMESAALAVELSPEDETGLDQAMVDVTHARRYEEHEQYQMLTRTRRAYPQVSARSILATHLAACDVALNPPCLPGHLVMRKDVSYNELHPTARVLAIWNTLSSGRIRPAKDIDDALRCADDICTELGWSTVSEVLNATAASYSDTGRDYRGRAFAKAVKGRLLYPPLLHNPWVPLWASGPLADMYWEDLVPAFFSIGTDCFPGGKDPARADQLTWATLRAQWARAIMLQRSARLQMPVSVSEKIRNHYREMLVQEFSAVAGRRLAEPIIENPG
jgi:hypothetical protein